MVSRLEIETEAMLKVESFLSKEVAMDCPGSSRTNRILLPLIQPLQSMATSSERKDSTFNTASVSIANLETLFSKYPQIFSSKP